MDTGSAQVADAAAEPGPETARDPDAGSGPADRRHRDVTLRVLCHLAVEVPILLLAVVDVRRGWRPLFDNADLALRSWQVLGPHPPSVGHQMAVTVDGHAVFGPGPLQSWILAVPVHLDPATGPLWGAALAAVVAVALAVEATWATGGWPAASAASGSVLVVALVRPEVVLDPVWNVWFALLVLVCTFCTGVAVATGRLGWWPVTVVAASVVVQCQVAYGPAAVGLCLVAPLLGLASRRRARRGVGGVWWMVGLVLAVVAWAAPTVQEATARPGNLTLLARAAGGTGPTIGWRAALRALGGATRLPPDWVHALPTGGGLAQFLGVAGIVEGPGWWGAAVLVLVAVAAVAAWRTSRTGLAATATLTVVAALGAVVTVATIPATQFLVLGYLGAVLAPVGAAVWVCLVWSAAVGVGVLRRRLVDGDGDGVSGRPGPRVGGSSRSAVVRWGTATVLVVLSLWAVAVGLGRTSGMGPTLVGWPAARAVDEGTAAALRVAPDVPFGLRIDGTATATAFAVEAGIAYRLATDGHDARPTTSVGYPTFGRPPGSGPTVVVTLGGAGRPTSARVEHAPG